MPTVTRAIWLTLPLLLVGTSLTLTASSEEKRAGVVAGLQGTASVTRASLPAPRPLSFKDDVYLRDRIVTGDASLARILLGGKALLTVRERSMVTITEMPGVSSVAVGAGRAAVNVVRDRMRPGETVEMRTPNATAAIRGTIVVAEVEGDGPGTRSTITVLRGLIDVTQHDAEGRAMGPAVSVGALQQVTVAATGVSAVRSISRGNADRLADSYRMGLRGVTAPSVIQSEVDRAARHVDRHDDGDDARHAAEARADKPDKVDRPDKPDKTDRVDAGGGASAGNGPGGGLGLGGGSPLSGDRAAERFAVGGNKGGGKNKK